jgi:hypothetical protein
MRKAISSLATGMALAALLTTSVVVAISASAASGATCNAIDAPKAMNDLPASADCPTPGATAVHSNALAPSITSIATTTIGSTPLTFDRTDGDVLVVAGIDGQPDWLAIGGDFGQVIVPDGVAGCVITGGCPVAARDFAIISKSTDAVLYAGATAAGTATNGYVRSITSYHGTIYIGGDFTSFGGSVPPAALPTSLTARRHAVALDSSFDVTPWNPAPTGTVRALAADGTAVYLGGDLAEVLAVNPGTGGTIWTKPETGGGVHALLETGGALYVGGLFEFYDGVTQHGLVKVNPSDGSLDTGFNANLRPDEGTVLDPTYGAYDGEEIISLSVGPESGQIFAGSGGHAPPGDSSNETILTDATTGARIWKYSTTGDSQAVGAVGDTVVAGYHNNVGTTTNVYGIQLDDTNSAPTTWDPLLTGSATTNNEDGGNGGVQSIYIDPAGTLYMAGAFTDWNGGNLVDKSLVAFSFTTGAATSPGTPAIGAATAGDTTADVKWTAPYDGGSPITSYAVTSSPGGITATTTGATDVTVNGLTDGTAYRFNVKATNALGTSSPSVYSNAVTPVVTTATSLGATPASPTTVGTSVTFTATISPSAGGSVQFRDGSSALGSPVAVSSGTASLTTSSLSQGTHSITAVFTPTNPAFSSSTSNTLGYEVDAVSGGGGGGGSLTPATTPAAVVRIAGADRFLTAVAAMNAEYPTDGSAGAVVLARADNYPDALVGTALAAAKNAPLLFVQGGSLTAETQAGIVRVLPAHGTVYLLGGTAAIPDSVATTLTNLGFAVTRYAGTDRYDTALTVATALGSPSTVFLATGINFPDALSAGPAAASAHGVVLLTDGTTLPADVKAYLTAHPGTVYAVGGPAVAADPAATPLQGADRYATAVVVASAIFSAPTSVGLASGVTFPDALSGGAYQAHAGGPILLTAPTVLAPSTDTYLTGAKASIANAEIFGGDAALSASVQAAITAALGG